MIKNYCSVKKYLFSFFIKSTDIIHYLVHITHLKFSIHIQKNYMYVRLLYITKLSTEETSRHDII